MTSRYCKIKCDCSNCDTELIRYKLKQHIPDDIDDLDYLCHECYNETPDDELVDRCQSCGLKLDIEEDDYSCDGCNNTTCLDCNYQCRKCDNADCFMCKSCIDNDYDCCNCGEHMCRCENQDELIKCKLCNNTICKNCFELNESFLCNKCNE